MTEAKRAAGFFSPAALGPEGAEVLREAFPEAIISVERVGELTEGP